MLQPTSAVGESPRSMIPPSFSSRVVASGKVKPVAETLLEALVPPGLRPRGCMFEATSGSAEQYSSSSSSIIATIDLRASSFISMRLGKAISAAFLMAVLLSGPKCLDRRVMLMAALTEAPLRMSA